MQIQLSSIASAELIFKMLGDCNKALEDEHIFQWTDSYPNITIIKEDIIQKSVYELRGDEEFLGTVTLNTKQEPQYQSIDWNDGNGEPLVIHRLAINPGCQGKGYAKTLMRFAEQFACEKGFPSVRLDAYSGNKVALQLYERLGYMNKGMVWFPGRSLPFFCFEKVLS